MKTFIFDLDDTLIYNSYHYIKPYAKLCDFVIRKIDPKNKEIKSLEKMLEVKREDILDDGVDSFFRKNCSNPFFDSLFKDISKLDIDYTENLVREGKPPFNCDRLPNVFAKMLEYSCKEHNRSYSEDDMQQVRSFACESFFAMKEFRPGAEEVLDFLKEKKDELIILTQGDHDWQSRKVETHKLENWFDEINIVDYKAHEVFERIIEGKDKYKTYMVGNSKRSDINPALKAGINAIYIPFETWSFEKAKDFEEGNVLTFSSLSDIITAYDVLN